MDLPNLYTSKIQSVNKWWNLSGIAKTVSGGLQVVVALGVRGDGFGQVRLRLETDQRVFVALF